MRFFKLPDLGEGLPEAEIVRWHVKAGDTVAVDQLLVEVETAKAVVEVPSPHAGEIVALFGGEGDIIHTGEPLLEFAVPDSGVNADSGTVVGELKQATQSDSSDSFIIGAAASSRQALHGHASPAIRAMAHSMGVALEQIKGSGPDGSITAHDVENASKTQETHGEAESLRGARRTMAKTMEHSHANVVPVTLFDDADIHDWPAGTDISMRLVSAIIAATKVSPALNGWFYGDTMTRRLRQSVDIGMAVDTEEGLFVPVLRDANHRTNADLRQGLDRLRQDVLNRSIPPGEMQGATITLSNFGTIAGRYANPIVVPPQIAILGAGVVREEVVARHQQIAIRKILPLSLTFDHRAATGGEAARFLKALIENLQQGAERKNQ
jgi:pyruvate dehydrogenase E2 component (dihydrolipoamide acetyltransferase)